MSPRSTHILSVTFSTLRTFRELVDLLDELQAVAVGRDDDDGEDGFVDVQANRE
jgi:hypothetical protein